MILNSRSQYVYTYGLGILGLEWVDFGVGGVRIFLVCEDLTIIFVVLLAVRNKNNLTIRVPRDSVSNCLS